MTGFLYVPSPLSATQTFEAAVCARVPATRARSVTRTAMTLRKARRSFIPELVLDGFEAGAAGGKLGLDVDDAVLAVFALAHGRHHPHEVDLAAGRGDVRVIAARHQDH